MKVVSTSTTLFALTFAALGISGLISRDFPAIWQPVAASLPGREVLLWLSIAVCLLCGSGLLWRRTGAPAALILLAALAGWLLVFRFPVILRAPRVAVSWEGTSETAVIVAGAWIISAALAAGRHWRQGVHAAQIFYGLALLPFGIAHFAYLEQTAALVPAWLPWHKAFVCLTGATYIAAGLAIISGLSRWLAARLVAVQMGLFTLLVWLPMLAAGSRDPSQWSETWLSWTLTISAWVVADSCRATGQHRAMGQA